MSFLVSAPNDDGRLFLKLLIKRQLRYALLTNNKKETSRLERFKHDQLVQINTVAPDTWRSPELDADWIVIFENSPALTWRYVQYCRTWTDSPIYIFTRRFSLISKRRELDVTVHHHVEELKPEDLETRLDSLLDNTPRNAKPIDLQNV